MTEKPIDFLSGAYIVDGGVHVKLCNFMQSREQSTLKEPTFFPYNFFVHISMLST